MDELLAELELERDLQRRRQALQQELGRLRAERMREEKRTKERERKRRQRAAKKGAAEEAPLAASARAARRAPAGNLGQIEGLLPGLVLPIPGLPEALAGRPEFPALWEQWMEAARRKGGKMPAKRKREILALLAQQPERAEEACRKAARHGWRDFDWGWLATWGPGGQVPGEVPQLLQEIEARAKEQGYF